jgi:hypothetical protein
MGKQNCWEHERCGREPGGARVDELGVCPAATCDEADGINSGHMGGRICWAIAGTLCGGLVQGSFAEKLTTCLSCPFFKKVMNEEGDSFRLLLPGQTYQHHSVE